MNAVTFNDHIRPMVAASSDVKRADVLWESPLFSYETTSTAEEKIMLQKLKEENRIPFDQMPFPTFRLDYVCKDTDGAKTHQRVAILHDTSGVYILSSIDRLFDNKEPVFHAAKPVWILLGRILWDEDARAISYHHRIGLGGKWLDLDKSEQNDSNLHGFYQQCVLVSMSTFCFDVMSPNNHLVAVSPNRPGKSVEWIKARTHYTLITHGHPANNASVAHGSHVSNDQAGEITRMAHNRRAHYKTLRHERYRFARGKRIFVRATWVGPKEWKDEGGKQIYRILEPVENNLC